ncbi:hypothetical protein EVAR_51782_1 [Eumeta japonica]|uniref:Uncharacterized protein n=1 Tax=Eumeta variegata TaxID=151549 RepID=A0A4C1XFN6_EUMVA|nr:hypothetical protein EVAR_51782_1 [Eumeta japonica]
MTPSELRMSMGGGDHLLLLWFPSMLKAHNEQYLSNPILPLVLEDLREEEGLKHYSDVYTKLYDFYMKIKGENVKLKDTLDGMQANTGILAHPIRSSDLAPCSFYLFSKIKEKLRGKCLTYAEEVVAAYEKTIEATYKCEWTECFSRFMINKQGRVKGAERAVAEYAKELTKANATINQLRDEISEAQLLADAMHARELTSVEALETIRKTVTRLEKELDAKKLAGDDDPYVPHAVIVTLLVVNALLY